MKVKAIKSFYDLKRKQSVKVGDEFEVTAERGKSLTTAANNAGYPLCEEVETPAEEQATEPEEVKAPKRKKKEA